MTDVVATGQTGAEGDSSKTTDNALRRQNKGKGGKPAQSQHQLRRNKGYNRLARRVRILELVLVAILATVAERYGVLNTLFEYLLSLS